MTSQVQTLISGMSGGGTLYFLSCCYCSVAKFCQTLCDPMDCSTRGSPVLHYLPEFAPIHVHWAGDTIQPSHPPPPPSPVAFNLFQHQGLFQWVSSLHQVAKLLKLQLQHHSFHEYGIYQWIFKTNFLQNWLFDHLSPGDFQESSPTSQFKSISSLALSLLYGPTLTSVHDYWEKKKHSFDYMDLCRQSDVSAF